MEQSVCIDQTKVCSQCKLSLGLDRFFLKNRARGWYGSVCSECMKPYRRSHYERNPAIYKERAVKRNAANRVLNRQRLYEILAKSPCVDCGEGDPVVLDFDHVRGEKRNGISVLLRSGFGWATIAAEIAKCEVRCSNCHRRRTAKEGGWTRRN